MPAPATTRAAATAWRPPYRARRLIVCLLATLVAGVAWATSTVAQNRTWKDNPSLWTHTVAISPGSDIANLNLGNHHARSGNNDKALPYYQQFARIRPDYILGWRACARAATAIGDFTAANVCYQGALKATRDKRSNPWTLHREYADALTKAGEFAAALRQQQAALAAAPQRERERDAIARSIEALTQRIAISGQSASSTHEPSASTPATSGAVAGDDAGAEAGRDVGGEP